MKMNSFNQNQPKPKKKIPQTKNFLEALRDLGGGVAKSAVTDVAGGIAEQALKQVTGQHAGQLPPRSPQPWRPDQAQLDQPDLAYREKQRLHFKQEFLNLQYQERLVWKRQEQETQLQVSAIVQELRQIAGSTQKLAQEVQVATQQLPVEPGSYHLSFFQRLLKTLRAFREQIGQSATWLQAFNRKAKKRNYYWRQVKKSGSKFMLSQERYMATQTG